MLDRLWSLVVVPMIVVTTVLHGAVSIVVSLFDSRGRKQILVARSWAQSLLWITLARVTVEGLDRIDPKGNYVFASNHLSYMDTPVVLGRIPVQFRFLAKEGLFKIPFMGTHLKSAGHIPVPRDDPRAAIRTLTHAAETVRALGISILIFPEGGRSEDGTLQEFKDGAAYLAIKAQVPVIPLALIGTGRLLRMHTLVFRPGPVRLRVGKPIPTEGMTVRDRQKLTEAIRQSIVEMLEGN